MTSYGSGFITISVGVTTSAGVSSPSGDDLTLWCESYGWDEDFKMKTKQVLTGDSYTAVKGKVARVVEFSKCVIYDDDSGGTSDNTTSLNEKLAFLRQFQRLDGKACYLIITNENESVNLKLTEKNKVAQDYMKGYIRRVRGKPDGGIYTLAITFVESTLL